MTIRHLLTMTAGFPTDDPWGDRQQGLPADEFAALLERGVSVNWAPGTRFEYSNLGYAILGKVVTAASGQEYGSFVRDKVLDPLAMTRTGFDAGQFAGDGLARGYRRGLDGWEEVPFDPYGAFAPMGGVYSCVRDLADWVSGFAAAFPPGAGDDGHPLAAASRREMQLAQVVTGWSRGSALPGGPPGAAGAYGFGLFVDEDPALGRVVSHSGGYPGFGSNMRWHPATGLGVIALGNGTYAPMSPLAAAILEAIVPRRGGYQLALAPVRGTGAAGTAGRPWPATLAAREKVSELLRRLADSAPGEADALFASVPFTENIVLDRPIRERRRDIALLRERIGAFADAAGRPPESDTPAHCRWYLAGENGQVVQAQIQLNPERPPRVQSLTLAIPPASGSPLASALEAVIAWLNSGSPSWPESVPVTGGADTGLLGRRLRMAATWTGRVAPGAYRAGDGACAVSVELVGEHARAILALSVDAATGALRAADVML